MILLHKWLVSTLNPTGFKYVGKRIELVTNSEKKFRHLFPPYLPPPINNHLSIAMKGKLLIIDDEEKLRTC